MHPHDWPFAGQDITFPEKALVSASRNVMGLLLHARRAEKSNREDPGICGETTRNLKAPCRRGENYVQYRYSKMREHYR
jgi:hypothetical protein